MNNLYFFAKEILWIIPPKNASTSIKSVIGTLSWIERDEAMALNDHFTVGVIRHPLDRAVSALFSVHMEMTPFAQRLKKYCHDSHVRPQAPGFDGFRVDHWVRFEHLTEDWAALQKIKSLSDLPHWNVGSRKNGRPGDWHDIDWAEFMPMYEKDFDLCSDWKRP